MAERDGNLVSVEFKQLFQQLTALREAVVASDALSEADKLEVSVDIETLKDQLAKPNPDPGIVARLWPRIAKAADLAGLAGLLLAIAPAIHSLTG